MQALRHANPKHDAQKAFSSGDLRLVANNPRKVYFQGVPDDNVVRFLSGIHGRYGFKVIAFNDELLADKEYLKLKDEYEAEYNKMMYQLAKPAVERE
jgi:hypothetical protein